jgi:hypothetical protein
MALPSNALVAVQTFQPSGLAYLENLCCFASNANAKFKDFQNKTANLGQTISFDIPPDSISADGLVASFQASNQIQQTLTCDQAKNAARAFTNQQEVFNLDADGYMEKFGKADVEELANAIEINLAKNADSSVPVMTVDSNGQSVPTGALHTESGPYRFFGDGTTAINSYQQLAQMITNYKNLGAVSDIKVFLPDTIEPAIIGSGLSQFVPKRNDETAMSWELGDFGTPPVKYLKSNLLPLHTSGTIGNSSNPNNIMTVVSTNDPTGQNVTQITFSTPVTTDSQAILSGDLFQFNDGVSGQVNMRYLTYRGHGVSSQLVQCRATANAASSGGSITVSIAPALVWASGSSQNINTPITAGMKVTVVPSHRCGLLVAGNAFYLAMPMLPDEEPFPTMSKTDPNTGLSLRMYYGSRFGQNQRGMVTDQIWGSTVLPKYSMRVVFPATV